MSHLRRLTEPKMSGVATPQVSSVVEVPGKAKAESDECPKIQVLRARQRQKYGDTFFSGKPVFPPPVGGPYGESKIRMKPDPRVYRRREFPSGTKGKRPSRRHQRSTKGTFEGLFESDSWVTLLGM